MHDVTTEKLVQEELQRQTGVTSVDVKAFEYKSVGVLEVNGTATIIIVRN